MSGGIRGAVLGAIVVLASSNPGGAVEPSACAIPSGSDLPSCHEGAEVEINNCWQRTIIATRALSDGYTAMKLKVTFTHPATGRTKSSYAFYDGLSSGRDVIRFRTSLSQIGTWNYSLSCEAGDCLAGTGLTNAEIPNRSLTVTALQAASSNPLFTKGHLGINRYISTLSGNILYENGERFYWLGDSAWAAPLRALPSEWKSYIDDRRARNFSVVQIGIAPEWAGGCFESGTPSARRPPFTNQPSGVHCLPPVNGLMEPPGGESLTGSSELLAANYPTGASRPDPAFWSRYERMIQYANCNGIAVLVTGVMEPVSRYPTFDNLKPFVRNLAARLSGNAVILSPGFDDDVEASCTGSPTLTGADKLIRDVGELLATTAPHLLTTNHFGTMTGPPNNTGNPYTGNSSAFALNRICNYLSFTTDPWMDFWLGQTGQNGNRLERITERPRTLMSGLRGITDSRFSTGRRPVVNAEAIYDHGQSPTAANPLHTNRFRARQANWLSWLSGSVGYTFGTMGVWDWGICGANPPPGGAPAFCSRPEMAHTSEHDHFGEAMDELSSQDVSLFKNLIINNTQWWKLTVSEQSRIKNQPFEPDPYVPNGIRLAQDKMMVLARDYNWLVAYMPHNESIQLELANLPFRTSGTFFTPRAGEVPGSRGASGVPVPGLPGVFQFQNPDSLDSSNVGGEDWVLGLQRSTSFNFGWSDSSTAQFETRPLSVDNNGSMALLGQVTSAGGVALSPEIEVTDRTKRFPFAARATRDGSGRFILAWQENGETEADRRVWLRRLSVAGNPVGAQFEPSQSMERCQNLSVAADAPGRFVAVWEAWNKESERFELQIRSFHADGSPMTDSLPFVTAPAGQLDSMPSVACDPNGACVAAWERRDADKETAALWLASFSLTAPWSISAYEYRPASDDILAVERLVAEGVGDFELSWERFGGGSESLGVTATQLDDSALPVGSEYLVREPWVEEW